MKILRTCYLFELILQVIVLVPPRSVEGFKQLLRESLPNDAKGCKSLMQHHAFIPKLSSLVAHQIEYTVVSDVINYYYLLD
jgi:hypothetical protein